MPVKKVVDPNDALMGDITDASNVGGANGFFKGQNGTVLEFYSFDVDGIIEAALVNNVWEFSLGVVPPANGGLGVALTDPDADRIVFWDDSAGAHAYLAPGNSIQITNTTIDTIQDIRSTASPTFANLNITNGGAIKAGQSDANTVLFQAYDVDGGSYKNLVYLTSGNIPTIGIYDLITLQGVQGTASIQTGLNTLDAILISAYDVDGAAQVPFITLVAGNTPSCNLSDSVTKASQYIYRGGGTDVPVTDGGTGSSTAAGARTNLGFASGTYTPTKTDVANIDSSTIQDANYLRVGNQCTVSGRCTIDVTLAATATEFAISLPFASALTLFTECSGDAHAIDSAGLGGGIRADITNDRAALKFISTADVGNREWYYHFTYTVV